MNSNTNYTQEKIGPDGEQTAVLKLNTCAWKRRNLVAFWVLGLCNHFAIVVMLSAAHDILQDERNRTSTPSLTPSNSTINETVESRRHLVAQCNVVGTGAILIAVVTPCLIVNATAAMYMHKILYSVKVFMVMVFAEASYLIVALSHAVWLSLLGAAFASVSSGFGELTFLRLTSHFHRNTVSTWASGTGAAGLVGSFVYAGFTAAGLSPRITLLIITTVPVLQAINYFFLLSKPLSVTQAKCTLCAMFHNDDDEKTPFLQADHHGTITGTETTNRKLSSLQKLKYLKKLLPYMFPLAIVYAAQYFTNHALIELIYFENIWLPGEQQYRWYMALYQAGVFISRSTVNFVHIKQLWIFPCFQIGILSLLCCEIFYNFIPNIILVFLAMLLEGLIGGWAYVNTFYRVISEVAEEQREFSMGAVAVGYQAGMALSGVVAVPVHRHFCSL